MRTGSFSSSQIYQLMSKGRGNWSIENVGSGFRTYVEEKRMERDLGRQLQSENSARPTAWGTLVEEQAFNKMGLQYSLVSKERYYHPIHKDYWNGMPDVITDESIGDIKCPWTMKSFCQLVNAMESRERFKAEFPQYYWQLVSNAILCDKNEAMLIVYCPYQEDLKDIRELAEDRVGEQNNRFSFINWADDEELPYLVKGKKYEDINMMEFEIPQEDKDILTQRVEMAIEKLNADD